MEKQKPPAPLSREEIRRRLKPMNLSAVARAAKVSAAAVWRLAHGEGDPLASTMEQVSDVLRRHAAGEVVIEEKPADG